jgi:hypothetical protein
MADDELNEESKGRWGLSEFQTGIVYLLIAVLIVVYLAYQLKTGRVLTKSGDLPLNEGAPLLVIETFAAGLGIFRGLKMVLG